MRGGDRNVIEYVESPIVAKDDGLGDGFQQSKCLLTTTLVHIDISRLA